MGIIGRIKASWGGRTRQLRDQYWATLKGASPREGITLEKQNSANAEEFHVYGSRLADIKARYFMKHGRKPVSKSNLLEIGCGIGRFTLPLACRFKRVYGVDVSARIIKEARKYCASVPNVEFSLNDGHTLSAFESDFFDYALCTGVMQHIRQFDVILSYLKEGLRALKPGGVFIFTFQAWQTQDEGHGRVGAKISARRLDEGLKDVPYEILEISKDSADPQRHMLVALRKPDPRDGAVPPDRRSFKDFPLVEAPYRTGIFEDLPSCEHMVKAWNGPNDRPFTFYD